MPVFDHLQPSTDWSKTAPRPGEPVRQAMCAKRINKKLGTLSASALVMCDSNWQPAKIARICQGARLAPQQRLIGRPELTKGDFRGREKGGGEGNGWGGGRGRGGGAEKKG